MGKVWRNAGRASGVATRRSQWNERVLHEVDLGKNAQICCTN